MPPPSLASAELSLMRRLWNDGPATAKELVQRLYPTSAKPQHGTVQRLLSRLEAKGYVAANRGVRPQRFAAVVSDREYAGGQLEALADAVTGGSMAPLLTHMVQGERLTSEEIGELRRLLDEHTRSHAAEDA
ncbi:MAG: BlaI/MecI/CopY family transcriptional regulator [Planctomycetota bacterium]